jgi:hypothetical protein
VEREGERGPPREGRRKRLTSRGGRERRTPLPLWGSIENGDGLPRVAQCPAGAGQSSTRGYRPSPRSGGERGCKVGRTDRCRASGRWHGGARRWHGTRTGGTVNCSSCFSVSLSVTSVPSVFNCLCLLGSGKRADCGARSASL